MPSGSRRAVVIGLNEYADRERIPSLHGAVNDATEIYRNLTLFGDFEVADRHFLTDEKGTSENIRRAISDLFWKLEPCELALLYFSGHGLQDGYGNGYLAPHDIRYDEPFVRGIKVQELRELFLAAKNKEQVLLILDCCHSGIVVEGDKDFPQTTGPFYQSLSASEDDIAAAGRGKFILASSGPDEKSRETRQPHRIRSDGESEHMHGLFTFHLLEGLNGRAADRNHRITLGRLHEYVTRQMEECKGHECFYWGFGSGSADIFVSRAGRQEEIEAWLQDAEKCLRTVRSKQASQGGTTQFLFSAMEMVDCALKASPELERAIILRKAVEEALKEYDEAILVFMEKYKLKLLVDFRKEFPPLEELATNLSFDQIMREPPAARYRLMELMRVSKKECEVKILINALSRVRSKQIEVALPGDLLDEKGGNQ